jgi:hypothetical protein
VSYLHCASSLGQRGETLVPWRYLVAADDASAGRDGGTSSVAIVMHAAVAGMLLWLTISPFLVRAYRGGSAENSSSGRSERHECVSPVIH